jgi:predicted dehydrogenase/threonine dehydrogenase-like Zn-dependent dehydrogenase
MKQIIQSPSTGKLELANVPAPGAVTGSVLVKVAASVVSAGTERAAAEFASKGLLQKAQARPDLVRDVLNKVRRDGILSAASTVRSRMDQPSAPGYSSAGTVVEIGPQVDDVRVGDRVACAGAGFAIHGEFACVPRMLVARIPSTDVDFESAAFTTLGAIALHASRIADAKLGETVGVIGLGLLGQLAVQILRAAGCSVIGIDLRQDRSALAVRMGAMAATTSDSEFRDLCRNHSNGYGVDSVLITAESLSSGPVDLAAKVARDRGIVVAVGAVGMELDRRPFYEKELDFRVSRSYGPGRYDSAFEQKGRDYPIGHVRWTETRNMEAFLKLVADGELDIKALISHRFSIENATAAYDLITGKLDQPHLGIVLQYAGDDRNETRRLELVPRRRNKHSPDALRIGMLGAGNFARGVLLPALKKMKAAELVGICASNGVRAQSVGKKFGFEFCTTEEEQIFSDASINTIVIASRHHQHAVQVMRALEAGKNIFCEKPLCLTEDELRAIQDVYLRTTNLPLVVGFNRRFAPMVQCMKQFLSRTGGPFTMCYRVNAGPLPSDHWINDPEVGGGRILGEMCHFVDLLSFFCGALPTSVLARASGSRGGQGVSATLEFEDGSLGTISYICDGDRSFSKERVEVFGAGCVAALDDFRRLELVRNGKKQTFRSWLHPDKGHVAECRALCECIQTGAASPIPFEEIAASTLAAIRIVDSLRSGAEKNGIRAESGAVPAPLVS